MAGGSFPGFVSIGKMVKVGGEGPYKQLGDDNCDECLVGIPGQITCSEHHSDVRQYAGCGVPKLIWADCL